MVRSRTQHKCPCDGVVVRVGTSFFPMRYRSVGSQPRARIGKRAP